MITNTGSEEGLITEVRLTTLGSLLQGAHAIGVSALQVEDAADFDETGGSLAISYLDVDGVTVRGDTYDYTSVDLDLDIITLSTPLTTAHSDGDWVGVAPTESVKDAIVQLAGSEETIVARIPHNFESLLVDGTREAGAEEGVLLQLVNDEWYVRDVLGTDPAFRSVGWEAGSQGWELSSEGVQLPSVNVLDTLGADTVTTTNFTLDGQDINTTLTGSSRGAYSYKSGGATGNTGSVNTTETTMFMFAPGFIDGSRVYAVSYYGNLTSDAVTGDVYQLRMRYTTDSTTSAYSVTSPTMSQADVKVYVPNGNDQTPFYRRFIFSPSSDYSNMIMGLTLVKIRSGDGATAAGRGVIKNDDPLWGFYILVEDLGPDTAYQGSLSQKSKATGSPDPDPTQGYSTSWSATWVHSYNESGATVTGNTSAIAYVGKDPHDYNNVVGNAKSLVGFDDASMRSTLSGATITGVTLTFKVALAYGTGGLDVRIRDHNNTSEPTTYSAGVTTLASPNDKQAGATYTVSLPVSFGTALRDGTARGVAFYAPTTEARYSGQIDGVGTRPGTSTATTPPKITITYQR